MNSSFGTSSVLVPCFALVVLLLSSLLLVLLVFWVLFVCVLIHLFLFVYFLSIFSSASRKAAELF